MSEENIDNPTVFIVPSGISHMEYSHMFQAEGWDVVYAIDDADLVQFTGGEDVSPMLYGTYAHPKTSFNEQRDTYEALMFKLCISLKRPMAGICRGGQFLNVMCGGKMWQHVDGHALAGTHMAVDEDTGQMLEVTSTHHQMMEPGSDGEVILWSGESSFRETVRGKSVVIHPIGKEVDTEAVFYPKEKCLCFQPHPEFKSCPSDCTNLYFQYIFDHLGLGIPEPYYVK